MTPSITPATVIRVFVSSTFIDMQHERHYLVNEVFPDIRRECARLGIDFEEIDLRWGISGETRDAEVLDYCLRQIDGCIPYLFAMIGGRYGWIPGDQPEIAAMLSEHERACSVTEIEIQRFEAGVRQRSDIEPRALIGLRTDAFTAELGRSESLTPDVRERLDSLRARLAPPREGSFEYGDLATLGAAVRKFFLAEARKLACRLDTPARYIEAQQEQYLRQLRVPGVPHIPVALQARSNEGDWNPLDPLALLDPLGDTRLVYVQGAAGSGKTTLCGLLARHWVAEHGGTVVRLHVGASGELGLNGIVKDLARLADADGIDMEDWCSELEDAILDLDSPTLVVIDGIERMIGWNQPTCPQDSLLFLTHQPGTLAYSLLFRLVERTRATVLATLDPAAQPDNFIGWILRDNVRCPDSPPFRVARIMPLNGDQRRLLARQFFSSRGKQLTDSQVELIGSASNITDFDALLLACDRMRRFGELHSEKRTQDDFVLGALQERFGQSREQTAQALIDEANHAHGLGADAVRATLMLLAASTYGVPAPVVVELVAQKTGPGFTLSSWAVLEGILGSFIIRNGTRYQFKNTSARELIVRTLGTEQLDWARAALVGKVLDQIAAMSFEQVFDNAVDALMANELPWLLSQLPGHPNSWRLLLPQTLLAWNARSPETATIEFGQTFLSGLVEPEQFDGKTPDSDPVRTVAAVRSDAQRYLKSADEAGASRLCRAMNGAQAFAQQLSDALKGRARLTALASAAAFGAALLDRWDGMDIDSRRNAALHSTLALLKGIAAEHGGELARSSPLLNQVYDWFNTALDELEQESNPVARERKKDALEYFDRSIEELLQLA